MTTPQFFEHCFTVPRPLNSEKKFPGAALQSIDFQLMNYDGRALRKRYGQAPRDYRSNADVCGIDAAAAHPGTLNKRARRTDSA
jgi:hypothetical protein